MGYNEKWGAVRNVLRNKDKIALPEITLGSYAFFWEVAEKGYKLVDNKIYKPYSSSIEEVDEQSPWLVAQDGGRQSYALFSRQHTLHRKFAGLHSEESIIGFANKYGLLGAYGVPLVPCGGGKVVHGESLEPWRTESQNMGILLAIWDLVRKKDAKKLSAIIIWPPNRFGVQNYSCVMLTMQAAYDDSQKEWQVSHYKGEGPPPPGYCAKTEKISSRDSNINPELLERWQYNQWIEPAKYYVCKEVNKQLKGHVYPQVLPFLEDKVYLFPDSLLSALWVMFLMEIMGNVKVRQCDVCGEWKEMKIARSQFYCSNTCRQKAYRKRLKQ